MLRHLHISNLAVIADEQVELTAGLNCFTGATGAGKSLVLGGLEFLLGLRSTAEMLRAGADEARVSGLFDTLHSELIQKIESITDMPVGNHQAELLLTRRLYRGGRASTTLNGNPITLAMLRQVAQVLVDVHGQHDNQFLLKPANQLDVLDQFGSTKSLRDKFQDVYQRLAEVRRQLQALSDSQSLRQQQLELYRFQANEIDQAELDPAEFQELSARAAVLVNLEKLKKQSAAAHAALYESDGAVLERLRGIAAVIAESAMLDPSLKPISESARSAAIQLEEVAYDLSRYIDRLDLDPAELREVDDRLNAINRLANKYGGNVEQAIAYRQQIGGLMATLEKAGSDLTGLNDQIEPLEKELKKLGRELSTRRHAAAKKLSPLVEKELADLGMDKARFFVNFTDSAEASINGLDQIEFMIQANPGLEPQALRKIASGGEMSRVMLALKSILADNDRVSVLVFDEIDANIGGRLGSVVGEKLRRLASRQQILCITHLPQIAAYADRQLTVRKSIQGKKTFTRLRHVAGDDRIEELAEMIGGHRITPTTRAQAQELLEMASGA